MDPIRSIILGSIIIVSLNVFSLYYLQEPSAYPFQGDWWSRWFPIYAAWAVFSIVGLVIRFRDKRKK